MTKEAFYGLFTAHAELSSADEMPRIPGNPRVGDPCRRSAFHSTVQPKARQDHYFLLETLKIIVTAGERGSPVKTDPQAMLVMVTHH
jgi:hypothetical protein